MTDVSALSDGDVSRLIDYLTEKHKRGLQDLYLKDVIATTVSDVLMVVEGRVSVDDFAPPEVT